MPKVSELYSGFSLSQKKEEALYLVDFMAIHGGIQG